MHYLSILYRRSSQRLGRRESAQTAQVETEFSETDVLMGELSKIVGWEEQKHDEQTFLDSNWDMLLFSEKNTHSVPCHV